jgi:hypothetical protein
LPIDVAAASETGRAAKRPNCKLSLSNNVLRMTSTALFPEIGGDRGVATTVLQALGHPAAPVHHHGA